jgi:hypothetical protein
MPASYQHLVLPHAQRAFRFHQDVAGRPRRLRSNSGPRRHAKYYIAYRLLEQQRREREQAMGATP